MPNIVLYRQARVDGGIRTGVDVDGESWEYYDSGSNDYDPALLWFVDLRAQGDTLPDNPEYARRWLLDNEPLVTATYQQLARRLEIGMDPDLWPLRVEGEAAPAGLSLSAVCSCMNRLSARQMATTVQDIAAHWKEYLERLPQVQHQ